VTDGPSGAEEFTAALTWSKPSPCAFSCSGFASMRTAGGAEPPTNTWPTPSTCDSRCASTESAMSYTRGVSSVSEVSARIMIGASAGFTLR